MGVVSIKFKKDGRTYYFDDDNIELIKDDYVLVDTEKGTQLGIVYDTNISKEERNIDFELKKVIKKASEKEYDSYLKNLKDASVVFTETKKKIERDNIPMRLIDAMYTFDKKQLIFNFVADDRVDFRELVKYLAAKYKVRIEMHQLGVRDKAKEIGGIGQCGKVLCCKSFKDSMDGISINMAKNQNISLNPSKINGCCGRLLCCLSYEDCLYSDIRNELPKVGDLIEYEKDNYKVVKLDVLNKRVYINVSGEEKVVDYSDK